MKLRSSPWLWWRLFLACACGACADDRTSVPSAPVNGVARVHGDETPSEIRDSGTLRRDADVDAAVPTTSCTPVPVLRSSVEDSTAGTATERPADFIVTRQAETWLVDCTNPKLILDFSDGICPDGLGHELSIALSINGIADGVIHSGNNDIVEDADSKGIQVRYKRPMPLSPHGTWGTCAGASGQLIFLDAPDPSPGATLQAQYELSLTSCDDAGVSDPELVVGRFKLVLHHGLNELCPNRTL
jgi:hypothetical protein